MKTGKSVTQFGRLSRGLIRLDLLEFSDNDWELDFSWRFFEVSLI